MIVSKPKRSTLFSLTFFLVLVFTVAGYNYFQFRETGTTISLALVALLVPIGTGLLLKMILGYRVVRAGKNKISVQFPFRRSQYSISLKDISRWDETQIKTMGTYYSEITIQDATGRKIKLSMQENTQYEKVLHYLNSKCKKKKTT